jgi:hypothetical protein
MPGKAELARRQAAVFLFGCRSRRPRGERGSRLVNKQQFRHYRSLYNQGQAQQPGRVLETRHGKDEHDQER